MKLFVILCGLIFVIGVSAQRRPSPTVTSSETPVQKSHTSRGRAKFTTSPEFAEIADTVTDEEPSRKVQPTRRRLDYERHTETRHRPQESGKKLSGHSSYEVEEVIDDIPRENLKRPLLRNRNTLQVSSTPVIELSTAKLEISSEVSEISSEAAITPESTSDEAKSEASLPKLFIPETSEATLEAKKEPKSQEAEPSPIVELVREEPRRFLTRAPLKSRSNVRLETTTHAARVPSRTRPPRKEITETTTHQVENTRTRNFRRRPADSVAHESTNRRSFSIENENEHPTRSRTGRKIETKITRRIDIDVDDEPNSRVRRTGFETASSRRREAKIIADAQVSEIGTQEKVRRRIPQKTRARTFEASTEALNLAPKLVRRNSRLRSMPPFDEAKLEVLPLFESESKTEKSTAVDVAPELSKTIIESTSPLTTPKQVTESTTTQTHEATTYLPKVRSRPRKNKELTNIETSSPKARIASRFTTENNLEATSIVPKVRSTRSPVKVTETTRSPVTVDTTTAKPKFRNGLNRRAPIREVKNNKLDTEPNKRNHHSTTTSEATPPRSRNHRKEVKRSQESTTSRSRNRHTSEASSTTESSRRAPKQERSRPKKIEPTISETRLQNLAPRRSRVQRTTTAKPEVKSEAPVRVPKVEAKTEDSLKSSNVEVKQEDLVRISKAEVNHEAPARKSEVKIETPVRQKAEVMIEAPVRQKAEVKIETPLRQEAEVKIETPVRSFKSALKHEAPARSLRRGVSRFNKMEDELHSQEVAESNMSKSVKHAENSETTLKRSRNMKRGTTKNHSDLTSSEEQIEESDNYPEPFKALIIAKKEKETRSKEDVILVTPEKIVSSSAVLKSPYPSNQRDQRKEEDNNIQILNSSPHAPRRSAPRTTTRVEISESTSENKIETALKPTALPPSTSTMKEVLTSITSKITRQRFHARFKADAAKSEKSKPNYANSTTAERNRANRAKPRNLQSPKAATGLYSSKKGIRSTTATPKIETTTHKRSYPARNNVVEHYVATSEAAVSKSKPHRFSAKYRSDILRATGFNKATAAPAYLPTVPTVTPVISGVGKPTYNDYFLDYQWSYNRL